MLSLSRGIVVSAGIVTLLVGLRYPDNPPPGHTGGFGERTCHYCHFENDINAPGGALTVEGLGGKYVPGASYLLDVRIKRDGMQRAGFQLATRFADGGDQAGLQAGVLEAMDERVAVDTLDGILYIRHTKKGTLPLSGDSTHWTFRWTAPIATGKVVFNLAGNAANGDASEFGDAIYLVEQTMTPKP